MDIKKVDNVSFFKTTDLFSLGNLEMKAYARNVMMAEIPIFRQHA